MLHICNVMSYDEYTRDKQKIYNSISYISKKSSLSKIRAELPLVRAFHQMACESTRKIDVYFDLESSSDHVEDVLPTWKVERKVDSFPCKYDDKQMSQKKLSASLPPLECASM